MSLVSCTLLTNNESKNVNHTKNNNSFEFALIGDKPYSLNPNEPSVDFDDVIDDINSQVNLKWVLHAGDFKSGSSPCSDDIYFDRYRRFNEFEKPFIYTPGDNEWTDCHRKKAGSYQPLERLKKLRSIFYQNPGLTLGKQVKKLDSQANQTGFEEFPENVRWIEQNIIFLTLHIVGSNNGLQRFDPKSLIQRHPENDKEVKRRMNAAINWMKASFSLARSSNSPAIFMMIHANPGFNGAKKWSVGFESFLLELKQEIKLFAKPVVLAHGDTHEFRLDSPKILNDNLVNFTRIETHGPYQSSWIRIKVDPQTNNIFEFIEENNNF